MCSRGRASRRLEAVLLGWPEIGWRLPRAVGSFPKSLVLAFGLALLDSLTGPVLHCHSPCLGFFRVEEVQWNSRLSDSILHTLLQKPGPWETWKILKKKQIKMHTYTCALWVKGW